MEKKQPNLSHEKTQVAMPTVNQALTKLLKMNKIEKLGFGRGTRYRKL